VIVYHGLHSHIHCPYYTDIFSSNDYRSPSQQQLLHDEEDFDQFLENVKARSLSLNKQGETTL